MLFLRCALYLAAILALAACAPRVPRYAVEVDAITSPQAALKKRYVLQVQNEQTASALLQYPEFTSYIHRALSEQGFTPAATAGQADLLIEMNYGISAPQTETIIRDIPIQGKTGGLASSTTTTKVSESGKTKSTTVDQPAYGTIGYRQETELRVTYTSYATMTAYAPGATSAQGQPIALWRINMSHTSAINDLRRTFPIMLASAKPYIGASSGHRIEVTLAEDDDSLLIVKGLPLPDKDKKKEDAQDNK